MSIELWHGSRGWQGSPEIRASRKSRAEYGPGIYGTTHYPRAKKYASGGGIVRKLILEPRLTLEQASLSLTDVTDFVTSVVTRSKQGCVLEDLMKSAERVKHDNRHLLGDGGLWVHAESLVNLCVNRNLAPGAKGQALAEFLTGQGIDCSFQNSYGREVWGVIFNPEIITSYKPYSNKDVAPEDYDLPDPREQTSLIRASEPKVLEMSL